MTRSRHWPVVLTAGDVVLRPLRGRDSKTWSTLRGQNSAWLTPWEATSPSPGYVAPSFRMMVRQLNHQARLKEAVPLGIVYRDQLVGQVVASGIQWGALRSGQIGYWISESVAGRGVMPLAVAMTIDHCFETLGLHRIEVNIRPENTSSLRVVEKLGLREEGLRRNYLHIDGQWRDHRSFAVTVEEVPHGLWVRYTDSDQR